VQCRVRVGNSENLKGIMNPRSDGSLVCSEGLLLPLDAEGRKGSPERRSLKLFPGSEETSIILVVYAHVGARLAGVPFPSPFLPLFFVVVVGVVIGEQGSARSITGHVS